MIYCDECSTKIEEMIEWQDGHYCSFECIEHVQEKIEDGNGFLDFEDEE